MELLAEGIGFVLRGTGYVIAGMVGIIVFVIVFGNKVIWKYRVEGYCEAFERDRIKITLKNVAQKGKTIEIRGKLKGENLDKDLTLLLNGFKIAEFEKKQNNGASHSLSTSLNVEEPEKGDLLSVRIENKEIYSEKIV